MILEELKDLAKDECSSDLLLHLTNEILDAQYSNNQIAVNFMMQAHSASLAIKNNAEYHLENVIALQFQANRLKE